MKKVRHPSIVSKAITMKNRKNHELKRDPNINYSIHTELITIS
jgi:hypothetical protein